jgi:hypothetical protein
LTPTTVVKTPDLHATATARAMATLEANTILYDPLSATGLLQPAAQSCTSSWMARTISQTTTPPGLRLLYYRVKP